MILTKLAARNLFRRRRRSILTLATMAVGFLLLSFSMGLAEGSYAAIIEIFTGDRVGHVQIHSEDYRDRPSLYKRLPLEIGEALEQQDYVLAWAPRIYAGALAYGNKKAVGTEIMGIDPVREREATRIGSRLTAGQFLESGDADGVMLTYPLARQLKVEVGQELVLISQAADGSIANERYLIRGIIGKKEDLTLPPICFMGLEAAQEYLVMDGFVHEIAIKTPHYKYAPYYAAALREILPDPKLDIQPWQVLEESFYAAMQADRRSMWVSLGIIATIVTIGVLNTVLMTLLERTREYGVLKAIGTTPKMLLRLIFMEIGILSGVGSLIGAVLALAVNGWFTVYGLELPTPVEFGGNVFTTYYSIISWDSYLIPAMILIGGSFLVSIVPVYRVLRMLPATALRHV